jgi:hypothetical protein
MANATGWNELLDGHIIFSVYNMYDLALLGWFSAIIFFVFQFVLWVKAKNITINFTIGLFFASLYAISSFVKPYSVQFMFILLALQLGGILFTWIMK